RFGVRFSCFGANGPCLSVQTPDRFSNAIVATSSSGFAGIRCLLCRIVQNIASFRLDFPKFEPNLDQSLSRRAPNSSIARKVSQPCRERNSESGEVDQD